LSTNIDGKEDVVICRCEEVAKQEIHNAIKEGYTTIEAIKRRTRAGMGFCQGKTCSRLVRQIIKEETDKSADEILPDKVRAPIRPIQIKVFIKGEDEI